MKDESIDLAKEGESVPEVPTIFLLLENPSKSNNLGPILRCASAFGILNVIAIGYSKCAVEGKNN